MSQKDLTDGLNETTAQDDTPNEATAAAVAKGRRRLREKDAKGCRDMDACRAALEEPETTR